MKLDLKQFTKEEIIAAISSSHLGTINEDYQSKHYDLIYNDRRFPVKNVFRAAFIDSGGDPNEKLDLNSTQAKKQLERLGFFILDKEEDYYEQADFDLLNQWKGTKYSKSNAKHVEVRLALKKVYYKTSFLAKLIKKELNDTFEVDVRRNPLTQSQHFDHYHWAKLYPTSKDKKEKYLAFTVGIENESVVCKIDTVGLGDNDPIRQEYFKARGSFENSDIVYILEFKDIKDKNWPFLVEQFKKFINSKGDDYSSMKDRLKHLAPKIATTVTSHDNVPLYSGPLNQILYGPPGTGKTRKTVQIAAEIVSNTKGHHYEKSLEIFNNNLHDTIEFITFHQNYSYEDFVQGLRPVSEANNGQLSFTVNDGIFKVMADKALQNYKDSQGGKSSKRPFEDVLEDLQSELIDSENGMINIPMKRVSYDITDIGSVGISFRKASGGTGHTLSLNTLKRYYNQEVVETKEGGLSIYYQPLVERMLTAGKDKTSKRIELQNYVLIIDEINRANISRVFGELITLIEKDKRYGGALALSCTLPSGHILTIPPNLYIIGTMNTADKSIALLDVALRRRFEFIPMYPGVDVDSDLINHYDIFTSINEQIKKDKSPDFMIGHSYFMNKGDEDFDLNIALKNKVVPLLLEYYMNNEKRVTQILQNSGLAVDNNTFPMTVTHKIS